MRETHHLTRGNPKLGHRRSQFETSIIGLFPSKRHRTVDKRGCVSVNFGRSFQKAYRRERDVIRRASNQTRHGFPRFRRIRETTTVWREIPIPKHSVEAKHWTEQLFLEKTIHCCDFQELCENLQRPFWFLFDLREVFHWGFRESSCESLEDEKTATSGWR